MSGWQKFAAVVLLATALVAGAGIYVLTRPASVPAGYPLMTLDGEPAYLSEFTGKPLIVNFWATWCPPCRREIPLLIQIQAENPDLTVVGIAVEEPAPVRLLAGEISFNYPILTGEQTAIDLAEAMGIEFIGLPYTVFVDADGRVLEVHAGELKAEDAGHALERLLR